MVKRIRVVTQPPLEPLRAWIALHDELGTIHDVKVHLRELVGTANITLQVNGFELLDKSRVDSILDCSSDIIEIHQPKRVATKRPRSSDGGEATQSTHASSSSESSDSSDSDSPPVVSTREMREQYAASIAPSKDPRTVPPRGGSKSTRRRNQRRRLLRKYSMETSSDPVWGEAQERPVGQKGAPSKAQTSSKALGRRSSSVSEKDKVVKHEHSFSDALKTEPDTSPVLHSTVHSTGAKENMPARNAGEASKRDTHGPNEHISPSRERPNEHNNTLPSSAALTVVDLLKKPDDPCPVQNLVLTKVDFSSYEYYPGYYEIVHDYRHDAFQDAETAYVAVPVVKGYASNHAKKSEQQIHYRNGAQPNHHKNGGYDYQDDFYDGNAGYDEYGASQEPPGWDSLVPAQLGDLKIDQTVYYQELGLRDRTPVLQVIEGQLVGFSSDNMIVISSCVYDEDTFEEVYAEKTLPVSECRVLTC